MNGNHLEILAPAGSPDALTAAVRCGAAAVYLGAGAFNARQSAHNFTTDELQDAVRYCHARGVAVYLTLNTLVRNDELQDAIAVARQACAYGVDALILQDVGLARILRHAAPQIPLHASTQLSCHTPAGVEFLRSAGFSRVVLAREMSRDEIASCAGRGVELEVFVHGALCMSVSGQCYFSAMLGGRSGNRGLCAQTCRLPFEPTGSTPRPCPADKTALSLKDNCLVDYVQELAELGVASLKIEGRMKRPEYVAAATAVYSAAAQGKTLDMAALTNLKQVFSRTGFTDGYYTGNRSCDMFGVRRKEDVIASGDVLRTLQRTYDREIPRISVTMALVANSDATQLTISDGDGNTVTASDAGSVPALRQSLEPARAEHQLRKTGGTPFEVNGISVNIPSGHTLPLSRINALRRKALDELLEKRRYTAPIPFSDSIPPIATAVEIQNTRRVIQLSNVKQWYPELDAALVLLPLSTHPEHIQRISTVQTVGVAIPRGMFGNEERIRRQLRQAQLAGAKAALCGNVGAIPLAIEAGLLPIGSFGLNITNAQAAVFYAERGVGALTLSMELSFDQIRAIGAVPSPTGLLLYGRQPLMLTRHCPRRSATGSCNDCRQQGITDRTGTIFPVMCDNNCAQVLNSVPLYWGDRMHEVPPLSFHLFFFSTETAQEIQQVLRSYDNGELIPGSITRGLYRRGVQ